MYVKYPADLIGGKDNVTNCIFWRNCSYACSPGFSEVAGCLASYSSVSDAAQLKEEGNISFYDASFDVVSTPSIFSRDYNEESDITTIVFRESLGEDNAYRHMLLGHHEDDVWLIGGNAGENMWCYGKAHVSPFITELKLMGDSPCIDAGNNEAAYLPDEDKAGAFRIYPGKGEWRVDMGAYEFGSRRLEITAVEGLVQPGYVKLAWNSQDLPGKTYSIYSSIDLLTWTLGGSNIPSGGGSTSWVDPDAGAFVSRFYKVSSP